MERTLIITPNVQQHTSIQKCKHPHCQYLLNKVKIGHKISYKNKGSQSPFLQRSNSGRINMNRQPSHHKHHQIQTQLEDLRRNYNDLLNKVTSMQQYNSTLLRQSQELQQQNNHLKKLLNFEQQDKKIQKNQIILDLSDTIEQFTKANDIKMSNILNNQFLHSYLDKPKCQVTSSQTTQFYQGNYQLLEQTIKIKDKQLYSIKIQNTKVKSTTDELKAQIQKLKKIISQRQNIQTIRSLELQKLKQILIDIQ